MISKNGSDMYGVTSEYMRSCMSFDQCQNISPKQSSASDERNMACRQVTSSMAVSLMPTAVHRLLMPVHQLCLAE